MWFLKIRPLILTLTALFALGCVSTNVNGSDHREVELNLQVQFEKRHLGASGFGGTELRPARHVYVEVRRDSDNSVIRSGYLDASGHGYASVPENLRVYLMAWAQVRVPGSGSDSILQGSVKNAKLQPSYANINAFNNILNVFSTSGTLAASNKGSLSILVPSSSQEAGAFNIADQMVTFGTEVGRLEPGLKLPNLHAFWSTDYGYTGYPDVAVDNQNYILQQQETQRSVFQFKVRRGYPNGADAGVDEFNDSVLLESMCHLLFADYSYPENGTRSTSILRRDNDLVYVSRQYQSEASAAFVGGYCDFLSGAFRNQPLMMDLDERGATFPFYLDAHNQFERASWQGEFYRGSVAISLWGIWKRALGGSTNGLAQMWHAARSSRGFMEYNNAPLGCYPTYLTGLKALVGSSWSAVLSELGKESIGDVTLPSYFNSTALWHPILPPVTLNDYVRTYSSDIYYDRDQSQAYRFTQNLAGSRTFTLNNTGGQDLFLEIFNHQGRVAASVDQTSQRVRQLQYSLPQGDYLVRVRAGYTTANNPAASFTLTVQ